MAQMQPQQQQQQQPPAMGMPVVQRGPIITLRYNGGPPPPHPPCTDPTPEEEYQLAEASRVEQQQQREVQRQQDLAHKEQKEGGSAFFKIAKLASTVASTVSKTAGDIHAKGEKNVREFLQGQDQSRFSENFPELVAAGDRLVCDYTCRVLHQGQRYKGNLQISNRYLCFTCDQLRDAVPLVEIASLQKSVALETVDNGPPFVMPIPAPHILYDTLQIFTTKGQVFQFLDFESPAVRAGQVLTPTTVRGRTIDRAYNFLDHTWRKISPVPLPQVQYAQY